MLIQLVGLSKLFLQYKLLMHRQIKQDRMAAKNQPRNRLFKEQNNISK
ncbi:unnamed protein product [Paramecium octaurelia]|uniref:Uncharacterized protein n=1 Tax=Paramecium octaurelia TaxID=43137 RepID=A0A8S1YN93_PAROT|nr:unnamed protein product [Paramecium octaurelia]